ncbi:uncharacterized protein LOC114312635 [Camellia sinensis]|uniref:uncharacterized protein LOC114312635 n=1 Tax=Camellia sinensis TaxID=4442 RepID=UPI00103621D7|nr:uncharacterized protein LOC114312635 [Camellia sinensis]
MSHFLFNIVAEGLNMLFERAKALGLIKGAIIGHGQIIVTHLQFADDTVVFCKAKEQEVLHVKRILRCFEVMFGLRINFHKSHVCGVGIQKEVLADFAVQLNCQNQKLSFMYMGLPLGASPKKRSTWLPVINKFKSKLASWKKKLLSFGGRLTLIKTVLSSLPVYYLTIFKVPVGVAKQLDKIQAKFLWGGSEIKKKLHMVKWEKVTMKKSLAGLGMMWVKGWGQLGGSGTIFPHQKCNSLDGSLGRCQFAWKIWTNILNWWGMQWVVPENAKGVMDWSRGIRWGDSSGLPCCSKLNGLELVKNYVDVCFGCVVGEELC